MVVLSILYGSEKKTWLDEQIQAFNAMNPALGDGRVIHVTGKAIGSGAAMTGILDGSERPIVFSPASGAYVTLLDHAWQTCHAWQACHACQSRDGHTRPIAPPDEPLVLSPIVIAMWRPMAEALGFTGVRTESLVEVPS
jgi:Ca-activated chloride channel homolog